MSSGSSRRSLSRIARQELNQGFNSRKRKRMSSRPVLRLLLKDDLKKQWCQALEFLRQTRRAREEESREKERRFDLKWEIFADLGEYARCFHSYIADKMKLSWPSLASALKKERYRVRDGAWWEEKYHVELLGHLKDLGFTMELWSCSLAYAAEDGYDNWPASFKDECAMNAQFRKDKEFLNSEEVRQELSPAALEMFTKLIEQYEVHMFV